MFSLVIRHLLKGLLAVINRELKGYREEEVRWEVGWGVGGGRTAVRNPVVVKSAAYLSCPAVT